MWPVGKVSVTCIFLQDEEEDPEPWRRGPGRAPPRVRQSTSRERPAVGETCARRLLIQVDVGARIIDSCHTASFVRGGRSLWGLSGSEDPANQLHKKVVVDYVVDTEFTARYVQAKNVKFVMKSFVGDGIVRAVCLDMGCCCI